MTSEDIPRIEGLEKIHKAWLLDVCEGNTESALYQALVEAYNLGIVEGVRRATR